MFNIEEVRPAVLGLGGLQAGLNEEELATQQTINRFAHDVMRPIAAQLDRMDPDDAVAEGSPLFDYLNEFDKLGLSPVSLAEMAPEQAGKMLPIIFEELGFGDCGLGLISMVLKFPAAAAIQSGDPELIEQFGTRRGCWIATQPDRGSEVVDSSATEQYPGKPQVKGNLTAKVFDDHIIVNGQSSSWVSGAPIAETALTYCAADYGDGEFINAEGSVNGISFLVDLGSEGISKGKPLHKLGQRSLPQGEIFFDNVHVPMNQVLVRKDKYQESFMSALTFGNMEMACIFTGVARAAYEHALNYVHERRQGGAPLIQHQLVRYRLFELFRKVEMARAIAQRAAWYNYVSGAPHTLASVTSKTSATELAVEVAGEALQLFGGNGLTHEYPLEKLMRDARASLIEDGENYLLKLRGGTWLSEEFTQR